MVKFSLTSVFSVLFCCFYGIFEACLPPNSIPSEIARLVAQKAT